MDSLTHILVGHAMGVVASTAAPPAAGAVYWAALIGNSLPDIDVPVSLAMRRGIKMHRTLTHTFPGVVVLSLGIAAVLTQVFPGAPFRLVFAWALLGNLTHLILDCLNLFGARPFWPFTPRSVDLGVLHILDPAMLAVLGVPTLASALGFAPDEVLIAAFFTIPVYIAYRLKTAMSLGRRLRAEGSLRSRVIPWFTSWRYIYETASSIEFGYWRQGRRFTLSVFPKQDSPVVRASMKNPEVASFLQSAEYPYAAVEPDGDGYRVIWGDVLRQQRSDFRPLVVQIQ